MKVLAINGSPRKDGNTASMLRMALAEIEAAGIETELLQLHEFGFDAGGGDGFQSLLQHEKRVAALARAAVYGQNFHCASPFFRALPTLQASATWLPRVQ